MRFPAMTGVKLQSARRHIDIISDDQSEHTVADYKPPAVAIKVETFRSEAFIIREDLLQLLNAPISLIESNAPDMYVIF
ncbi:MAG: hypothetical protein PVG84_21430 [Desulfobacterales bacterium]|jgi:hypothetical protein